MHIFHCRFKYFNRNLTGVFKRANPPKGIKLIDCDNGEKLDPIQELFPRQAYRPGKEYKTAVAS